MYLQLNPVSNDQIYPALIFCTIYSFNIPLKKKKLYIVPLLLDP